jgi:hypothetical protein
MAAPSRPGRGRAGLAESRAVTFHGVCFLAFAVLLFSLTLSAQDLPAGTALEVRLSGATGSRISHPGDAIEATIIAPATQIELVQEVTACPADKLLVILMCRI